MRRISRTVVHGVLFAVTVAVASAGLVSGCASPVKTTERSPSCSPASLQVRAFDEERAPAGDLIEVSETFRTIVAEWLLLSREAEVVKKALDQALLGVPVAKTPKTVQVPIERLAQIRESMRSLIGLWKQAAAQTGAAPEIREWMRELSLDPVFGPRLARSTLELQDALTQAIQSQVGCEPSRKIASQPDWNMEAIRASPELVDLTPVELISKVGLTPATSAALLKKRLAANAKVSRGEVDALDWIDWDGRSVMARLQRLDAFGVKGVIRLETEQPHALWVKARLEQGRLQGESD